MRTVVLIPAVLLVTTAAGPALAQDAHPADAAPRTPRVLWAQPLGSVSFGGGAAADVDGDGKLDIAFATYFGDGTVHVLRGLDGKELWSFKDDHNDREHCLDASVRFADFGDGLKLIVPGSSSCSVMAFDAA